MLSRSQMKRELTINLKSFKDCNEMPLDPNITYIIQKSGTDLYYNYNIQEGEEVFCHIESDRLKAYSGDNLWSILPYLDFEYELVPFHSE